MSRAATLTEFESVDADTDGQKTRTQSDERRPQWSAERLRCQCGADIREWHSTTRAREIVRIYANADGVVPGCPACQDWGHNQEQTDEDVPHAIKNMQMSSSAEFTDRATLALKALKRGDGE